MDFENYYRKLIQRLLQRDLKPEEGLSEVRIYSAEQRLGLKLPQALREYYRLAGSLDEVNRCHNRLLRLEEVEIVEGYLLFMEENQNVVLWGVKTSHISESDPEVWQGVNNDFLEWYAEEMPVSQFLHDTLEWQMGFDD